MPLRFKSKGKLKSLSYCVVITLTSLTQVLSFPCKFKMETTYFTLEFKDCFHTGHYFPINKPKHTFAIFETLKYCIILQHKIQIKTKILYFIACKKVLKNFSVIDLLRKLIVLYSVLYLPISIFLLMYHRQVISTHSILHSYNVLNLVIKVKLMGWKPFCTST